MAVAQLRGAKFETKLVKVSGYGPNAYCLVPTNWRDYKIAQYALLDVASWLDMSLHTYLKTLDRVGKGILKVKN